MRKFLEKWAIGFVIICMALLFICVAYGMGWVWMMYKGYCLYLLAIVFVPFLIGFIFTIFEK